MNPRLAAIVVLPVLLHLHLSVAVAGTTVAVSLPWVIPAALILAAAVLLAISWRSLRGFRSSPYMRTANQLSPRKELIMGLIKGSGKTASDTRKGTLHGSQPKRGMAKWGGQLQRLDEKPKGPKGPGKGK